jgi:hypothetical protein
MNAALGARQQRVIGRSETPLELAAVRSFARKDLFHSEKNHRHNPME